MSIIAIDYDETITDNTPFPNEGQIRPEAFTVIPQLYEAGHTLILWTSRTKLDYEQCVKRLKEVGLYKYFTPIDSVHNRGETGKIQADIYVDDRSVKSLKQLVIDNMKED